MLSTVAIPHYYTHFKSVYRTIVGTQALLYIHRCKQIATLTKETTAIEQKDTQFWLKNRTLNKRLPLPQTTSIANQAQKIGFTGHHTTAYPGRIIVKEEPSPISITIPIGYSRIRYYGF